MSLLGFYGFDHCKSAVGTDGVSPINGTGPDSWGYTGLSVSGGTTDNPIGVSSAAALTMGKGPKRRALAMVGSASQANTLTLSIPYTIVAQSNKTFQVGFRFKVIKSSDFAWASGAFPFWYQNAMASTAGTSGTWPITAPSQTPAAQTFFASDPFDGQEHYLEMTLLFNGNSGSTAVNTIDGVSQTVTGGFSSSTGSSATGSINSALRINLPKGSVSAGTITFLISDIYVVQLNNGNAPYNARLGDCKVVTSPFDNVTANTFTSSPAGTAAADAIASVGDNETLVSEAGGSSVTMALSEAPAGLDSSVLATQAILAFSKDASYSGAMSYTAAANGTSGSAVSMVPGTTVSELVTPLSTTLPDGTALTPSNLTDYSLTVAAT